MFKEVRKHVVSRSGEVETGWRGSVLLRDPAAVKRLKPENGPDLVMQGRARLVWALPAEDLVDAMGILTVPPFSMAAKSCSRTARRRMRSN